MITCLVSTGETVLLGQEGGQRDEIRVGQESRKGLRNEKAQFLCIYVKAGTYQFKYLIHSLFEVLMPIEDTDHAWKCL